MTDPTLSIRLPAETRRQLEELMKLWGESRSAVIRRCIDRLYAQVKLCK